MKRPFLETTLATPIAESSSTTLPPAARTAALPSASVTPAPYWTTYSRSLPSVLADAIGTDPTSATASAAVNATAIERRFRMERPPLRSVTPRRHRHPTRRRHRLSRRAAQASLLIWRAAFAPGPPVIPPPGCAPDPAR